MADGGVQPLYQDLAALVEAQAETIASQAATIERLGVELAARAAEVDRLSERVAELERELGRNSGNSGKPPSRDPAGERKRQAAERAQRAGGGEKRKRGKQRGAKGSTLEMSPTPDRVVEHRPSTCDGCGSPLASAADTGYRARQVVDLPEVKPEVTEHRAVTCCCAACGTNTTGAFPDDVRAPVSYGPTVRAVVCYLMGRQHLPNRRSVETMADLFGLDISTGAVDSFYAEAARRLKPFIVALIAVLKSLPVLHADETTDRIGTTNCWMHVVSTSLYTLIHASLTRGYQAIEEAGVLVGYRGVIIHDRLALYWKLKKAKHGLCAAHLLRDLADVAVVASQTAWAAGLAALLVEMNNTCLAARDAGRKRLTPTQRRTFTDRYRALVDSAIDANPEPVQRVRNPLERRSHNLAIAFRDHQHEILLFMNNLQVSFTNNQAERDLRPVKLHRKTSGCFRSPAGAKRHADLRSYLSTTRKHDIPAIDALTRLFQGNPWIPPQPT